MKNLSAHNKGFTLIELVIVISIMLIIAGGAMVNVISFTQNQSTTDDAKLLITEFRRAYSKATGVYYPGACTNLTGYTITAAANSQTMTITANCAVPVPEARTNVLKMSKFRDAVNFTFRVPDGVLLPSSPTLVVIKNINDQNNIKTISVSSNGVFQLL